MSRELENPVINIFEEQINQIKKIEKNTRSFLLFSILIVFFNINKIKHCVEKYPFNNLLRGKKANRGKYVHLNYKGTGKICSMTYEQARNVPYGQKN